MFRCHALVGLAALALLVGCESYDPDAGVTVTGKVVQGGQPINAPRNAVGYGGVEVFFVGEGTTSSAYCDESGNFEIIHAGEGIPPGKYKVAIIAHGSTPEEDKLAGKLSEANTKIEKDVPKDKLGGKHDVGTIEVNEHIQ
jgi:hypothetical protein